MKHCACIYEIRALTCHDGRSNFVVIVNPQTRFRTVVAVHTVEGEFTRLQRQRRADVLHGRIQQILDVAAGAVSATADVQFLVLRHVARFEV